MELTKKYRIVYNERTKEMTTHLREFDDGVTYVHSSMVGVEFDTKEEAIAFINDKELTYEGTR